MMNKLTCRGYAKGPVKLAVFDLAGTTLDFGSMAPVTAFVELFASKGVALSVAEARGPMGMRKHDHIVELLKLPAVAEQWTARTGRGPTVADADSLYEEFVPLQKDLLSSHAELIAGVRSAVESLRAMGVRIGVTTGYSRDMMSVVLAAAECQGFRADVAVCGCDVQEGRPAPWMAIECARRLDVYPLSACVHFGDTLVDVQAGRNAGMWSVGVAETGNMTGLPLDDWRNLEPALREELMKSARRKMYGAGAHLVLDSASEAPAAIALVNEILAKGGGPDGTNEER